MVNPEALRTEERLGHESFKSCWIDGIGGSGDEQPMLWVSLFLRSQGCSMPTNRTAQPSQSNPATTTIKIDDGGSAQAGRYAKGDHPTADGHGSPAAAAADANASRGQAANGGRPKANPDSAASRERVGARPASGRGPDARADLLDSRTAASNGEAPGDAIPNDGTAKTSVAGVDSENRSTAEAHLGGRVRLESAAAVTRFF